VGKVTGYRAGARGRCVEEEDGAGPQPVVFMMKRRPPGVKKAAFSARTAGLPRSAQLSHLAMVQRGRGMGKTGRLARI